MTTLDKINGECFSVQGLRFYGKRWDIRPGRFSIIAQNDHGAVELWSEPYPKQLREIMHEDTWGGLEFHSPQSDGRKEPNILHCDVLGGPGWCDGSGLAYDEVFLPLIQMGDSRMILKLIAGFHEQHFGPRKIEGEVSIMPN